jgi:acyl-coenzyme A synthetase/AMP-(fatty) acid ligase/acyl carrier protein
MISHGALRNHMLWMQAAFPLCKNDVLLQKTALSFDASVWEILGPLLSGATLALAKPEGQKDPSYLCNAIARWEVTTLQMVPSGLQLFLDDPGIQGMKSLRNVFSGGEPLTAELSKKTLERLDARVHNLYGPTETCIQSVVHSCGPAEQQANNKTAIPIGRPISNTQTYVADQYLQLVPPGNVAELYIGGAGVARGYCGRPDLTAERFLPNPFGAPGSRLYRTGDLVRHLANGTLEFCGRVDDQIKLRGYRIELHEIEQTLLSCPGVQRAIVIARDDGQREKRLVAYVTVSEKDATDAADLRSVLEQSLPQYMVPSAFVVLDEFPVMPNGKIDRQALPAPDPRAGLPEYVAPRTPREEILAKMWTETLGIEQIGMDDNFFDLGGTSVALVRIFRQAQKLFGITMQISAIAKAATIGSFARAVEEKVA